MDAGRDNENKGQWIDSRRARVKVREQPERIIRRLREGGR